MQRRCPCLYGDVRVVYIVECPSCREPFLRKGRALYCSLACGQTAELVRYARRKRLEGTFDRADIAEAIDIRRSQIVLKGGYDKRAREVSEQLRAKVFARAGGRCQNCGTAFGAEGDYRPTIQHCNGDSNDEADLQAWCWRCNMEHARSVPVMLSAEQARVARAIIARWEAPQPLRVCDDQDLWPKVWREFRARLSEDEYEDLDDYYHSCCEYNTGSADGDAYFAHVMGKD